MRLSLPLSFPVHSIMVNNAGDLLAIYGPKHVVVAEIPDLDEEDDLNGACAASMVSQFIPLDSDVEFLKVSWHPLSAQHLVLLTSDNTLRFLNVDQFESGAEQTFSLDHMLEEELEDAVEDLEVVNFCFGDTTVASWQAFCVFLLNANSDVFVLCPIVPYGCRIPSLYFITLRKFVYSQIEEVEEQLEASIRAEMSRTRRRGLPSGSAASVASSNALNSQKMYLESQLRWINAVTGDSRQDTRVALEAALEVVTCDPNESFRYQSRNKSSYYGSYNHTSESSWYFDIALQGPLETQLSPDESPQSAAISSPNIPIHDIQAISAIPLVLGRTHASGHVELLVGINHVISPGWTVPSAKFQPNIPTLLLWSGVDLSVHSGSALGKEDVEFVPTLLLPTPPTFMPRLSHHAPSTFLIYSSCGIVRVDIPWMHQIDSILTEKTRTRDLPLTKLQLLWNCVSIDHDLPKIIGASVYSRPITSGATKTDPIFIVPLFESGAIMDVSSIARPSLVSGYYASLMSSNTISASEYGKPSILEMIDSEQQESTQRSSKMRLDMLSSQMQTISSAPARLGPKTFRSNSNSADALSNNYNLQFYQQISRQFESCEDQLQIMEDNIRSRLTALEKRSKQNSTSYEEARAKLSLAAAKEVSMSATLAQSKATLSSFKRRIDAVNEVLRFAADHNSEQVDVAWISELERIKKNVNKQFESVIAMENELGSVSGELQRAKLLERGIPADLDESHAAVYVDTLDSQDKSISSLAESVRKLQMQMEQLESSAN